MSVGDILKRFQAPWMKFVSSLIQKLIV